MKKGYVILEVGWEYDDESYSTADTFEAPNEIFLDKKKAETEFIKREIKAYRNSTINHYAGYDGLENYLNQSVSMEELIKYAKDNFDIDMTDEDDYYEFNIPKNATDKQVEGLINMLSLRFNELHEVNINE